MLSDLQREFYKTMLIERKHIILDETYNKIAKKNEELENECQSVRTNIRRKR